ncbi:MAG: DUF1990 domain-containing protein [Acidobacteriota bacterium]|nr:DUF1990 domain-containing protein [Acidobacteriota bacterium]
MFLIAKPTDENIRQFLEVQKGKPFSYAEVGAKRDSDEPDNYIVDHNRVRLGAGRSTFKRAVKAVRSWKMFDLSWTELHFDDTPIETGRTVAILIKHFGFWSLNAAQIVYVLDETTDEIEKFGFAYGTLTEHGERGEERFSVEYHKQNESVWYDLYAFSQPNYFLAKLGYPASRYLQKHFAIESKLAMAKAVGK